jgi:putative exosortase-associated protein (TIGR04073 family)
MKCKSLIFGMILLTVCIAEQRAVHAQTAQPDVQARSESQETLYWAGKKFMRGITNIATGLGEIPIKVNAKTKEQNLLAGMTTGLAEGFGWALMRIGAGLWDTLTTPGALFISDEKPIIEPETVFDYDKE